MKAQENFLVNMNIKTEPTDKIDFNETNINVSFKTKAGSKNTITNTLEYSNLKVNYELGAFNAYQNLDGFNQIQDKLKFSHEISDKTSLNFSITPMVNFQSNLDTSDFSILGSFEIRQQLNSKTNISIGAARTTVFGTPKFMPVLALNYIVNNQSSLLIGFPDSKISYSNNNRNKFSLSNSFNGNFYHLDPQKNLDNNATKVSLSQMTSAIEYERNVEKNWFLNFKAGYDFDKKYNLMDNDDHKVYDFNTGNGYVLGIGIKYKQ
ncbi:DUF6268 family outer membrane beta-barrel protein [Flavobacterium sp. FlaQc-51]|uniref:DUF6268 family outer membrane beta-barrel protein n=1 Tax=unclassified Flavobacterium TaxID=196869 RepID=UPI001F52133F|nr:DUF6268 family outer membrane beta-barrel protein [Flavobacterium sp. Leaf82]